MSSILPKNELENVVFRDGGNFCKAFAEANTQNFKQKFINVIKWVKNLVKSQSGHTEKPFAGWHVISFKSQKTCQITEWSCWKTLCRSHVSFTTTLIYGNVNFYPSVLGQKFFVRFLGELKKPKSPFEINWPLEETVISFYVTDCLCTTISK